MGRYYALAAGEEYQVADAILEHYRPRFAGDALPESVPGMLVSAADKLDTMCGIFAIGQGPTGSADPFALRRGAIGVLSMVLDGGLRITLDEAISAALAGYEPVAPFDTQEVGAAVKAFLVGRLEGMLRERGHAFDTVAAVLAVSADDPGDALRRCEALTTARAGEAMRDLEIACARARNLGKPELGVGYDRTLMGEAEITLADAVEGEEDALATAVVRHDYDGALALLADLRGPIDTFFDAVLVMDDDAALRDNRLRLLNRFVRLFDGVADFSQLQG
jgi:glycyl-tRNA synthetase beta chain